jgi:tellurite resistance protein TerC
LALDLFLHRGQRETSRRAAIAWSVVWIVAGLAFALFVQATLGPERAIEYVAAYAIEKSLSLDNLFVFLIVFKSLSIPKENQRRGLSWGIFGALAFRAVFIFLGAAAIERWSWIAYVFGALLLVAAYRAFLGVPKEEDENRLVAFLSRHLPVSRAKGSDEFVVREAGRLVATPLLVAVLALELTDVLFAIDSVPAALAVSRDEFVVYSSNAFAILGLRSLYLVMAHTIAEMRYLHYGLAGVLAFAALKLISADWIHVSPLLSVAIIVTIIAAAVWTSLRAGPRELG